MARRSRSEPTSTRWGSCCTRCSPAGARGTLDRSRSCSRARTDSEPTAPSSLVPELDREVGRLIMSCLAREPSARPSSALAVLATLPGGDPLQAAIAEGETPSPEMVAAAGVVGDLSAKAAWAWLGCALLALLDRPVARRPRDPAPAGPIAQVARGAAGSSQDDRGEARTRRGHCRQRLGPRGGSRLPQGDGRRRPVAGTLEATQGRAAGTPAVLVPSEPRAPRRADLAAASPWIPAPGPWGVSRARNPRRSFPGCRKSCWTRVADSSGGSACPLAETRPT